MSEPFIKIRGGAATPQPPRRQNTPGPPPPPPHPHPPAPGQQGGGGGGPITQSVPLAQAQNMAHQVPPPPFHTIPPELRGRPAMQVCDIRAERMTEGDAREALTQFKVIRFEKCATTNEVDVEGKAIKPTWGKCCVIDENDIEQVEARKKVKILDKEPNKEGRVVTISEKKTALPAALKSQLERQQALLQRDDDPKFIYTLVQLEDLTKPLDDAKSDKKSDAKTGAKDKKKKEKSYEWDKGDTKKIATEKKSKTKLKERIGVRAYYKRSPGPDQDCLQLLHQHQAQLRQHQQHQRDHVQMMMINQQQQHHAMMHPPQPPPNEQPPQGIKPADVQILQLDGKKGKRPPRSDHGSESSFASEVWSESDDDFQTPQSSVGSHISGGRRKHRRRERKHYKDKAKYYNMDRVPRTVPVAENLYTVTRAPRGGSPPLPISPQPRLPPVDPDRLRSSRYWDNEEQLIRDRHDGETRRRVIEPAYTYHTLERQRSYPRMSPLEPRHERFDNIDFEREHRDAMAHLDRIVALEEERERELERERERRADEAAYERYLRDRPRERRVVVTTRGLYERDPAYHAPYIRTVEPTYLDQEARAEEYMERRSAGHDPHPFQPRRRRVYEAM